MSSTFLTAKTTRKFAGCYFAMPYRNDDAAFIVKFTLSTLT
jgi:hypothetical protein